MEYGKRNGIFTRTRRNFLRFRYEKHTVPQRKTYGSHGENIRFTKEKHKNKRNILKSYAQCFSKLKRLAEKRNDIHFITTMIESAYKLSTNKQKIYLYRYDTPTIILNQLAIIHIHILSEISLQRPFVADMNFFFYICNTETTPQNSRQTNFAK